MTAPTTPLSQPTPDAADRGERPAAAGPRPLAADAESRRVLDLLVRALDRLPE